MVDATRRAGARGPALVVEGAVQGWMALRRMPAGAASRSMTGGRWLLLACMGGFALGVTSGCAALPRGGEGQCAMDASLQDTKSPPTNFMEVFENLKVALQDNRLFDEGFYTQEKLSLFSGGRDIKIIHSKYTYDPKAITIRPRFDSSEKISAYIEKLPESFGRIQLKADGTGGISYVFTLRKSLDFPEFDRVASVTLAGNWRNDLPVFLSDMSRIFGCDWRKVIATAMDLAKRGNHPKPTHPDGNEVLEAEYFSGDFKYIIKISTDFDSRIKGFFVSGEKR
jgi:hypothetical protein